MKTTLPCKFLVIGVWLAGACGAGAVDGSVPRHDMGTNSPVHQWIVYQAFRLLTNRIEGSEITNYFAPPGVDIGNWRALQDASQVESNNNNILVGSVNEDKPEWTSTIFVISPWREPIKAAMAVPTHFMETSADMDATVNGGFPSAYTCADYLFRNRVAGGYSFNKAKAYYFLGHICHLLADMTLPSHVMEDMHMGGHVWSALTNAFYSTSDDPYEKYVWREASGIPYLKYGWAEVSSRMADGWTNPIPFLDVAGMPDLRGLWWATARYTEDYDSKDCAGFHSRGEATVQTNNWFGYRTDAHHPADGRRISDGWWWKIVPGVSEYRMTDAALAIQAEDLMPHAILRTADLFRLFYATVDKRAPGVELQLWQESQRLAIPADNGEENPLSIGRMAAIPIAMAVSNPVSGIVRTGKVIRIYSGTNLVLRGGGTNLVFTPSANGTVYRIEGEAIGGNGKTGKNDVFIRMDATVVVTGKVSAAYGERSWGQPGVEVFYEGAVVTNGGVVVSNISGVATSRTDGGYAFAVPWNWSGTVDALSNMTGMAVAHYTFSNLRTDRVQDISWTPAMVKITGRLWDPTTGTGGGGSSVVVSGDSSSGVDLREAARADDRGIDWFWWSTTVAVSNDGTYCVEVPYGWSGSVAPGVDSTWLFSQESLAFENLQADAAADFTRTNTGIVWSTYIGGTNQDEIIDMATDDEGNSYVGGKTASSGWTSGGYDTEYGGAVDGFVAKLGPDGELLWSTYVGGTNLDVVVKVLCHGGHVFVVGNTGSGGWVQGGAATTMGIGNPDSFVVKLTADGQHEWSTYLVDGWTIRDAVMDSNGSMQITGGGMSLADGANTNRNLFPTKGGISGRACGITGGAGATEGTVAMSLDGEVLWTGGLPVGGLAVSSGGKMCVNQGGTLLQYPALGRLQVSYEQPEISNEIYYQGENRKWRIMGQATAWGKRYEAYPYWRPWDEGGMKNEDALLLPEGEYTVEYYPYCYNSGSQYKRGFPREAESITIIGGQRLGHYVEWPGNYLRCEMVNSSNSCGVDGLHMFAERGRLTMNIGFAPSNAFCSVMYDLSTFPYPDVGVGDGFIILCGQSSAWLPGWYDYAFKGPMLAVAWPVDGYRTPASVPITADGTCELVYNTGYAPYSRWTGNDIAITMEDYEPVDPPPNYPSIFSTNAGGSCAAVVWWTEDELIAAGGAEWPYSSGGYSYNGLWNSSFENQAWWLNNSSGGWISRVGEDGIRWTHRPAEWTHGCIVSACRHGENIVVGGYGSALGGGFAPGGSTLLAEYADDGELLWSSTLGNTGSVRSVQALGDGSILAAGNTATAGWAWQGYDVTHNGLQDGYVAKVRWEDAATGRVQVVIEPEAARRAGGQWSMDGGNTWHDSGEEIDVPTGRHAITLREISNWDLPRNAAELSANVWPDRLGVQTVRYVGQAGYLDIHTTPDHAPFEVIGVDVTNRYAGTGGAFSRRIPAGTYRVDFGAVAFYDTPASQTVSVVKEATTTVSGTYVQRTGTVSVCFPAELEAVDARWSVDGGTNWYYGGERVEVAAGSHTVRYAAPGYDMANQAIEVESAGVEIGCSGSSSSGGGPSRPSLATPVRQTGTLRVDIQPVAARTNGALWRVAGGAWQSSGSVLAVPTGDQVVEYLEVEGWQTPQEETVAILRNSLTMRTGTYTAPSMGLLTMQLEPAEAVAAGARWLVGNGDWQASGVSLPLSAGTHSVGFMPLSGWKVDPTASATVAAGEAVELTQTYVRLWAGGAADHFTETLESGKVDLAHHTFTLVTNGSGDYYAGYFDPADSFPTPPVDGVELSFDETTRLAEIELTDGREFPFYGESHTRIWVHAGGLVGFYDAGTPGAWPRITTSNFFVYPQLALLHHPLMTAEGGPVNWRQLEDRLAITFEGATSGWAEAGTNAFQVELFYDGAIRMTWLDLSVDEAFVGISEGRGYPDGFIESDISGYPPLSHPAGELSVRLLPEQAELEGARWQCDGGAWRTAGLATVLTGSHQVAFVSLEGWATPEPVVVDVVQSATVAVEGAYVQLGTGTVTVAIEPGGARAAGAEWRLQGGDWRVAGTSAATWATTGTVEFRVLDQWTTPATVPVSVPVDGQTTVTGKYVWRVSPDDWFTEWFEEGGNDLAWHSVTLEPDDSANGYRAFCDPITEFPADPAGGVGQHLGDDGIEEVSLTNGAVVWLYGQAYTSVWVGANGTLMLGEAGLSASESYSAHFAVPRISGLYRDLECGTAGRVSWAQRSNCFVATYEQMEEWGAGGSNNFQMELFFDGRIRLSWLGLTCRSGLAGISGGSGLPDEFRESDLVAYPSGDIPGGVIRVGLTPNAAVDAGARWRVDGGSWRYDGDEVSMPEGAHVMEFRALDAWVAPSSRAVQVEGGGICELSAAYRQGQTLIYRAGMGGAISGVATQLVEYGENGGAVEAVPNEGYRFVQWSDGVTNNPRVDMNVAGSICVTGTFASLVYRVEFDLAGNGERTGGGALTQNVIHGANAIAPTVVADTGWLFLGWDRVFTDVRGDMTITALYEERGIGTLQVNLAPSEAVAAGARWRISGGEWKVSGASMEVTSGNYAIEFKELSGWTAPTGSASVTSGGVAVIGATYVVVTGSCLPDGMAIADGFENRIAGELTPWQSYGYAEGTAPTIGFAGVTNLTAFAGSHAARIAVNNPNPGGWSGFGLVRYLPQVVALPDAAAWSNIVFSVAIRESAGRSGTVTLQLVDENSKELNYSTTYFGTGWQVVTATLRQFAVPSWGPGFNPNRVRTMNVKFEAGSASGTFTVDFDEISLGCGAEEAGGEEGWLQVVFGPACAAETSQWRTEGGAWFASGQTAALTSGTYALEYRMGTGWLAPTVESAVVGAGRTNRVSVVARHEETEVNLALPTQSLWMATASSIEEGGLAASLAIDGNTSTRWGSEWSSNQWLQIDFGQVATTWGAELQWETAYATEYAIELSEDGETWTQVFHTEEGGGGVVSACWDPVNARYMKVDCIQKIYANRWGFSLWEIGVFGSDGSGGDGGNEGAFKVWAYGREEGSLMEIGIETQTGRIYRLEYKSGGALADGGEWIPILGTSSAGDGGITRWSITNLLQGGERMNYIRAVREEP